MIAVNKSKTPERSRAYKTLTAGELAVANLPDEEWILEDLIAEGKITILAADTGVGKSMLAEQIGIAVASGIGEVMGFKIPSAKRVLFINLEMTDRDLQKRLLNMLKTPGIKGSSWDKNLKVTSAGEEGKTLMFDSVWERIEDTIVEEERYDLIIVDNLYTSITADEESNKELKRVIQKMHEVAGIKGSALLLIAHHIKHNKERDYLDVATIHGASSLQNNVQIIFQIAKSVTEPGLVLLRVTKNRFSPRYNNKTLGIRMNDNTCWFERLGMIDEPDQHLISKRVTRQRKEFLDNFDQQITRKEVVDWYEAKGMTERAADKRLKAMVKAGTVSNPSQGVYMKTDLIHEGTL